MTAERLRVFRRRRSQTAATEMKYARASLALRFYFVAISIRNRVGVQMDSCPSNTKPRRTIL